MAMISPQEMTSLQMTRRVVIVIPQVPRAAAAVVLAVMVEVFVAKVMITARIMTHPHS